MPHAYSSGSRPIPTFQELAELDPEFIKGFITQFLSDPQKRDFDSFYNILKFMQKSFFYPQKAEKGSYLDYIPLYSRVSKFLSSKNETDLFFDLFKVKEKERGKWINSALSDFHSLKRTPTLLREADESIKNKKNLTIDSVLETIKEYKEKIKNSFSCVMSSEMNSFFPVPALNFLGAGSIDKLNFYENVFSTLKIATEGIHKIKLPLLSESQDPCEYFSVLMRMIDGLKNTYQSFISSNNPFLNNMNLPVKGEVKKSIEQSIRLIIASATDTLTKYASL